MRFELFIQISRFSLKSDFFVLLSNFIGNWALVWKFSLGFELLFLIFTLEKREWIITSVVTTNFIFLFAQFLDEFLVKTFILVRYFF